MAGSEVRRSAGERVRRRIAGNGLQARNTQAARDALRRRQKEKKARIVKRHVRYKDKKKLLEQLAQSERPAPIVAKELCRDDDEDLEETKELPVKARIPDIDKEDGVEGSDPVPENDPRKNVLTETVDEDQPARTDEAAGDGAQNDDSIRQEPAKRKKYVPFMKEQKEYERAKQEREAEMNERRRKIEEREQMLQKSKKQRRAKAKQVRKITPRGQPKLKYQLDAILARIQKE